jgi:molecular chaperone GrpE (heat shock protein)
MARNHDLMAAEINRHSQMMLERIDDLERALRQIQVACESDNEYHDVILAIKDVCNNYIGPKTLTKERG